MKRVATAVAMWAAALVLACLIAVAPSGCSRFTTPAGTDGGASTSTSASDASTATSDVATSASDAAFARAFADRAGGVELEGRGTVERLLNDDTDGARHQRFIVRLDSGQTLLIAHNIDVAPRVEGLQVGDTVAFKGEYEWNAQGGVVHWTHHDPTGGHTPGWIEHEGRTYSDGRGGGGGAAGV